MNMENIKKEVSFKINFTPSQNFKEGSMRLTFFGTLEPILADDGTDLYEHLKTSIIEFNDGYIVSNIQDICANDTHYDLNIFDTFSVFLFTNKDSEEEFKRKGILFGNIKGGGLSILAVWPYAYFHSIKDTFNDVIDSISTFMVSIESHSDLLLLTKK